MLVMWWWFQAHTHTHSHHTGLSMSTYASTPKERFCHIWGWGLAILCGNTCALWGSCNNVYIFKLKNAVHAVDLLWCCSHVRYFIYTKKLCHKYFVSKCCAWIIFHLLYKNNSNKNNNNNKGMFRKVIWQTTSKTVAKKSSKTRG